MSLCSLVECSVIMWQFVNIKSTQGDLLLGMDAGQSQKEDKGTREAMNEKPQFQSYSVLCNHLSVHLFSSSDCNVAE